VPVADTDSGNRKRFVVRADEKLAAFVEIEAAIQVWQRVYLPRNLHIAALTGSSLAQPCRGTRKDTNKV
jgi:hypothetical protein